MQSKILTASVNLACILPSVFSVSPSVTFNTANRFPCPDRLIIPSRLKLLLKSSRFPLNVCSESKSGSMISVGLKRLLSDRSNLAENFGCLLFLKVQRHNFNLRCNLGLVKNINFLFYTMPQNKRILLQSVQFC